MAVIKQSEVVQGGIGSEVPKRRYRVRCINTTFKPKNQKGNPMTTLTLEIIAPEKVTVNGRELLVAGNQGYMYLTHVPDKTWGQAQVFTLCKKLGIELPLVDDGMGGKTLEYDTELHKEYFHGREFDCVLSSSEDMARYELTEEDVAQGKSLGEPILDGEGNPIKRGWRINMVGVQDIPDHCNPDLNQEIAAQPY